MKKIKEGYYRQLFFREELKYIFLCFAEYHLRAIRKHVEERIFLQFLRYAILYARLEKKYKTAALFSLSLSYIIL